MTTLGQDLLSTREGAAFLACGAAVGRLGDALADPGVTLCLAAHAIAEVRRGTDRGRLAGFVERPGSWLLDAAGVVDAADTDWWSAPVDHRVLRRTDDHTAGVEVHDVRGRRRSAAEEADAHLHTFSSRDAVGSPSRIRLDVRTRVLEVDGPDDLVDEVRAALADGAAADAPAVHLTLRGALTIDRSVLHPWPWAVAGVFWRHGIPDDTTGSEASGPEPRIVHDHAWPPIGRPYDPRFDEGDEVDGSELDT